MGLRDDEAMDGVGEMLRAVAEGNETVFDIVTSIDPETNVGTKRLEVVRRKLMPELPKPFPVPDIARARARNHVFNEVTAFAAYLSRCGGVDTSLILADVNKQIIEAVLDESGEFDREHVQLQAVPHPLFTPWATLLNKPIKVMDFSLFIMQNRRAVVQPDGRELAMIFQQIKMSKAVTVNQGAGKKSLNGVMVDVEIAGQKQGMAVELPEDITIHVPLFVGSAPQNVVIDLLVTPGPQDDVLVYCTCADVQSAKMLAFEDMLRQIGDQTEMLVGFGQLDYRDWDTVPFQKQ